MRVISVEENHPREVFDVEVEGIHAFTLANDTIVHNSSYFLGRSRPTFEDTVGTRGVTFDQLPPSEGLYYAACDTADTYGLYLLLRDFFVNKCPKSTVDVVVTDFKLAMAMVNYYLDNKVTVDNVRMKKLAREVREERDKLTRDLFKDLKIPEGTVIKLQGPQLEKALQGIGIHTGKFTDTGRMKVDKKTLEEMDSPVTKKLIRLSKLNKQLNSYVDPLSKQSEGRINYGITNTPTGRLRSGQEKKKNDYFLPINYQNLTKPGSQDYKAEFVGDDPGNPELILGYKFSPVTPEEKKQDPQGIYVEALSQVLNIRNAITVPNREEWYFVGIDYSQEELRIIGGLARDEVYTKAFTKGMDLYQVVGSEMFGLPPEEVVGSLRKKSKAAVLGLNYGGSAFTIKKTSGLPDAECEQIVRAYRKTVHQIEAWKARALSETYHNGGLCFSAYGRLRWLGRWLNSIQSKEKSFGVRSVASHKVQGSAADIIRRVMVELEEKVFSKYPSDVRFVGSVHDEVDIVVKKDKLSFIIPLIREVMEIVPPGSNLILPVELEVGYSYGYMFPFRQDEKEVWIPN